MQIIERPKNCWINLHKRAGKRKSRANGCRDGEETAFANWLAWAWYVVRIACVMELNSKFIFVNSSLEKFHFLLEISASSDWNLYLLQGRLWKVFRSEIGGTHRVINFKRIFLSCSTPFSDWISFCVREVQLQTCNIGSCLPAHESVWNPSQKIQAKIRWNCISAIVNRESIMYCTPFEPRLRFLVQQFHVITLAKP